MKLKIDSWPQAAVIMTGLVTLGAMLWMLVRAGWGADSIVAFAALAVGTFTGQTIAARKASVVEAKTDAQTESLEVIKRQTNGVSLAERQDIAERAAAAALRRHNAPAMYAGEDKK